MITVRVGSDLTCKQLTILKIFNSQNSLAYFVTQEPTQVEQLVWVRSGSYLQFEAYLKNLTRIHRSSLFRPIVSDAEKRVSQHRHLVRTYRRRLG